MIPSTGFSFNIIALIFLAHKTLPKSRPYTQKFFSLSYYNPTTDLYGIGWDDSYFIAFCILLFMGLRSFFMEQILGPLAKHWGVSKKGDLTRFSEQAWLLVYYCAFWPLGMVRNSLPTSIRPHGNGADFRPVHIL